jgi:hypothetical protein
MDGEEQRADPSDAPVAEKPASGIENEVNNQGVYENAEQMKAERKWAKDLPQNEKAERHEGTIVVGRTSLAYERPYRGSEDLRQVMPALYVRILKDLLIVVVHESVKQRVSIGQ